MRYDFSAYRTLRFALSVCALFPYYLLANPQGCDPKSGNASLSHSDQSTLTVHTSDQAVIHWDSFSIDQGETTRFIMPSAASSVLNRVVGGNLSAIYGTLEANGKIFLINPKGILIGENAHINTASFFASTLDALDADFLKAAEIAFVGDSKSAIVNLGTISAWDGDIALIAARIENRGVLEAKNGIAALAAGTNILLSPQGNQRILIRACSLGPQTEEVGIDNSGKIQALQAELKADGHPYQFAIKDSGHIDALAIEKRGGQLYLVAEGGHIDVSGNYKAANTSGQGGQVHLLGQKIDVSAQIDVSGSCGGGTVLIGGDYQGGNPDISNAQLVMVSDTAQIRADALLEGNGGKVILWGDKGTGFWGEITARGGSLSGDGGFVEVSSPGHLAFSGKVDTSSTFGEAGTLLLDPCTVTISTAPTTAGVTCNTWNFGSNASANINNGDLGSCLASNNVTINASTNGGVAAVGSITVNADVTWNAVRTLTLLANDSSSSFVQLNALISPTNPHLGGETAVQITTGDLVIGNSLHTQLNDSGIQSASGLLNINVTNLQMYGGNSANSNAWMRAGNGTITINASGDILLEGGTGSGSAVLVETSSSALASSITINGSGNLSLLGGTGDNSSAQVIAQNAGSIDSTITGDYTVTGGTGSVESRAGFYLGIAAPGQKGSIDLTGNNFYLTGGIGSGGGTGNCRAEIQNASTTQSSIEAQGDIVLQGSLGGTGTSLGDVLIATGSSAQITAGGDFSLLAGSGVSSSVQVTVPTQLDVSVGKNLHLKASSGTGALARLECSATTSPFAITIGQDLILEAGSDPLAVAEIVSTAGVGNSLSIDWMPGSSGTMTLTADEADAIIHTTGATSRTTLKIGQDLEKSPPQKITMTGGSGAIARAIISVDSGGVISATVNGDYEITGGTSNALVTDDARAGFSAGTASVVGGDINLTGNNFTLQGGPSGIGKNLAQIATQTNGSVSLIASGDLTLTGGGGDNSNAEVSAPGLITAHIDGTYFLTGGSGATTSLARFTATEEVSLHGFEFFLKPGSSAGNSNAVIESTGVGSSVLVQAQNLLSLAGNATANQSSLIRTTATSGNNPVTIHCKSLAMNGGSASNSSAEITTDHGAIKVFALGNVNMIGGSAAGANAWIHSTTHGAIALTAHYLVASGGAASTNTGIHTASGNIVALCTADCIYTAPTATGLSLMRTVGSDLSLTAVGSIDLSGFTVVSTPDPGHLLLIAGSDIHIGADAQVLANGIATPGSSLTLVVDAKHPVPPQIGLGRFLLDAGATLQVGSQPLVPVRIFTARQSQNTISANINTAAYVPGTEFVDTATERWGVYFPSPFYGNMDFTLFYKNTEFPPSPPVPPVVNITPILVRAAFIDSEGFYNWSDMDRYVFDDIFAFSNFDVGLAEAGEDREAAKDSKKVLTSYDVINDKGLSIRRRKQLRERTFAYE